MPSPHIAIRDCFISERKGDTCFGLGEWRRYQGGVWQEIPELIIKREIQRISARKEYLKTTNSAIVSIFELLKAHLNIPSPIFDANPNLLIFDDCVLNLETNKKIAHSPKNYATSKLPFKYDPKAESKEWERFLQHLPHAEFLQEFAGYCLTSETKYELALWLWGPPGGGKSTFVEALCTMLGPKACVLGLSEIDRSSFALAQLPGKTLSVSTELPSRSLRSPNIINALISGEMISFERKYRDPITMRPHVKLLWAMNNLPSIDLGGVGIFRRIVPVYIPSVPENERDPAVKSGILASGMAVVNWALAGLRRLQERGRFDVPPELLAARDGYRQRSDLTLCFVDECCERDEDSRARTAVLYKKYRSWCLAGGYRAATVQSFTADLDRLGFIRIKPHNVSYYTGLDLIDDSALDSIIVE